MVTAYLERQRPRHTTSSAHRHRQSLSYTHNQRPTPDSVYARTIFSMRKKPCDRGSPPINPRLSFRALLQLVSIVGYSSRSALGQRAPCLIIDDMDVRHEHPASSAPLSSLSSQRISGMYGRTQPSLKKRLHYDDLVVSLYQLSAALSASEQGVSQRWMQKKAAVPLLSVRLRPGSSLFPLCDSVSLFSVCPSTTSNDV